MHYSRLWRAVVLFIIHYFDIEATLVDCSLSQQLIGNRYQTIMGNVNKTTYTVIKSSNVYGAISKSRIIIFSWSSYSTKEAAIHAAAFEMIIIEKNKKIHKKNMSFNSFCYEICNRQEW